MSLRIDLPDELAGELAQRATQQRRTVQEVVIDLLNGLLGIEKNDEFETLEQVVARIQSLPRNPAALRPAQGSLADALRRTSTNEDFDLEEWNQEWAKVEAELRSLNGPCSPNSPNSGFVKNEQSDDAKH